MKRLVFAFATMLLLMLPAMAEETTMQRMISINGHGETRRAPDLATIQIGVTSYAKTAKAAVAQNSKTMQGLLDGLKASGISNRDLQTSNFSVNARLIYANDGTQPKQDGYDVSNTLAVTVRELAKLGEILDRAVDLGSNQINGISFGIEDSTKAMDDARKEAVADARRKAELYAAAAGVTLGDVLSIGESGGMVQQPMVNYSRKMSAEAADAVPVAQGEQVLGIDVAIVWALK
jgi:uncharacterized protein